MENNSDICGIVSSIVLDCFLVHYKNKNFGAYTQILDTIECFCALVAFQYFCTRFETQPRTVSFLPSSKGASVLAITLPQNSYRYG